MGRISDNPGLDESRSAPTYRDRTGETAVRQLMRDRPMTDWHVVGPKKVVQYAHPGLAADGVTPEAAPDISNRAVQLNLMPEVALAVLQFIDSIAEPLPSRSGNSNTYRLKKNAGEILADHTGNTSPKNR